MTEICNKTLTGERALFGAHGLRIKNCTFEDGESPIKESAEIDITDSEFRWKYPAWYSKYVKFSNCKFTETARAGVWYSECVRLNNCVIEAPKTFRRAKDVIVCDTDMPNAEETFWNCNDVTIKRVTARGAYFAMNCENFVAEDFTLYGDYCFDGAKNVTVRNAKLISKDCFWNSKNVTVYDSYISGEYLGWNSENLTFINCTLESLQGLCYVKNLKLVNCVLKNTTLAFEYSTVDAHILGGVDSVKNPLGGKITAGHIGELILEEDKVNPDDTVILCSESA